jgi:NADPH:quinone reductase-like Zn-dependent oxidoreductase
MKAMQMDAYGGPEVLRLRDMADPVAGDGQVMVHIHAASVNPVDWKLREGQRRDAIEIPLPHTLGLDFSGVVVGVGAGVDGFAAGDEVFGVVGQNDEGGYAEAIAVDAGQVAAKPESLSHVEAAALALVGLTALYSLEDTAGLKSGEIVLVQGGAGGVGGFAVQLVRHLGATVHATASARNRDYVLGLGAHQVIDYTAEDFTQVAPKCDVVYDTVGGAVQSRSFSVLKPGGRLVYIARGEPGFEPTRDDVKFLRPQVGRDRAHLERIARLVADGAVWPPEITTMPLAETGAAHELSRTGHVRGKIVLQVR